MQPDSMTGEACGTKDLEALSADLRSYGFAELRDQTLPRHECDIRLRIISKLAVVFTQT